MPNPIDSLTPREREVAGLISHGLLTKEISQQMGIAYKTASQHRGAMLRKLHARNAAHATRMIVEEELRK